jgi:hypothetical protein
VLCVIVLDLVFYSTVRQIVAVIEYLFMTRGKRRLIMEMENAESFSAWKKAAMQLDKYLGMDEWKNDPYSKDFDFDLVSKITRRLRRYRLQDNVSEIVKILTHSG